MESDPLFDELAQALAPHFLLVRPLGRGGMGRVYLARDPALKRQVAVKVLAPGLAHDPSSRARFALEAEAMAAIPHPNIVSVYEVGHLPQAGTSFIVMQFVSGGSLREEFPAGHPAPEARIRQCIGEIAGALAAAHRVGVVHRDIKPSNVMLDRSSNRFLVLDFGISAVKTSEERSWDTGERMTHEHVAIGTPQYMSPEQASGTEVTGKSDVYSLGCVAFELLTGAPPFAETTPAGLIASHLLTEAPALRSKRPDLDPAFASLVDRCLAKEPDARPTAEEITRVLLPSVAVPIEWPPPGLEPMRGVGRRWNRAAGFTALLGVAFFAELMMHPTVSRICCWGEPESSRLWSVIKYLSFATPIHFDDPDAMSVWYFALDATFILLLLSLPFAVFWSWRLARWLQAGRAGGYPWAVVLQAAWDRHADTEALLNGTGATALLSEPARRQRLARRKRASGLLVGAILLACLMPVLWLYAGGGLGWRWRGAVLGLPDAVLLWLLPLLALLGALLTYLPELRLRFTEVLERPGRGPQRVEVSRELVAVWLATAGIKPPPERWVAPAWLVSLLPTLLFLALLGTVTVTLATVFMSTARMLESGRAARAWLAEPRADSLPRRTPRWEAALALQAAGDRGERPAVDRLTLARAAQVAYCLSPREVLFGVSSRRADQLQWSREVLAELGDSAERGGRLGAGRFRPGRLLGLTGLGDLSRRQRHCNAALGGRVSTVDSADRRPRN